MKSKIYFIILFVFFNCFFGFSQEKDIFQSLDGMNKVAEVVEKLWSFFDRTDDEINKKKIRNMAVDLKFDITDIIVEKKRILMIIQDTSTQEVDFSSAIYALQVKTNRLITNLSKHQEIIKAIGLDAAEISSDIKIEFSEKALSLENIKKHPKEKDTAIKSLNKGIEILNRAQKTLNKFGNI